MMAYIATLADYLNAWLLTGGVLAIPYTFSTATTDADPGDGILCLNSATQNAATVIRADLIDAWGKTWTTVLDTFGNSTSTIKGDARLVDLDDEANFLVFSVTAIASPSGYRNITVTNIGGSAASPFADGAALLLTFSRSGDKGETGPQFSIVAAGGTADAITATYSPAITLADKQLACFVSAGANTSTTPTFAPNGLTAHTITARGGAALIAGDIGGAGYVGLMEYNLANTRWELLNPVGGTAAKKNVGTSGDAVPLCNTANSFSADQTMVGAAFNEARATLASHATTADIWGADGNQIDWTGTATTTAFPAAPQAGVKRELVCAGACSFTAGANMLIDGVASAATVTCAANDIMVVRAVTTTQFRLTRIKYDGTAQVAGGGFPTAVTPSTGNVTLTNAATQLKHTSSKFGNSIKFPDATTCTIGLAHVLDERGEYPARAIDNTGTLLGFVPPKTVCHATLDSISSQAGIWAIAAIQALGIGAQLNNTTATNSAASVKRVEIDANRTCLIAGGTTLYAVVIDKSTGDVGAPTIIRSSMSAGFFLAILSAASQVMVVTCDTTTGMEAVTLTIDSTTGVTTNSGSKGAATLAGNIAAMGQLKAVGSSFVVSYGRATNVSAVREITLSGNAPTIRNESAATSASGVSTAPTIQVMSSTVVIAIESDGTTLYAKPWTISGGASMTGGTEATKPVTSGTYRTLQLAALGNVAIAYKNTSTFAGIISLSGTIAVISSTSMGTACTSVVTSLEMVQVSSTKVACMYHVSSTDCYFNNFTDSSGTVGVGTEISYAQSAGNMAASSMSGFLNSATSVIWSGVATKTICYDVNPSGASPTFTNVFESVRTGSAEPLASDMYGVRHGRTLVAGGAMYGVNPGSGAVFVTRYSAAGITTVKQPDVHLAGGNGTSVSGSTSGQSWWQSVGANTTGLCISLVEAAF